MAWDDTQTGTDSITHTEWNAMVAYIKPSSGASDPTSTPSTIGQTYFNTTNKTLFFAVGTSSSSDWKEVFLQG